MARLIRARPPLAEHVPAEREWHGPLIGRKAENVDEYLTRVAELVKNSATHLYFDASFLMWLAKLGEKGRGEFLAWQSTVGESRFHVPLWAAHEYFKHRLQNTVPAELVRYIKTFDNAASNLYEKLRVYCSDGLFGFPNSGVLFLDEYRRTVQPVRAMLKLAEKSDQMAAGVQDIAAYIDARLLPGPLQEVLADIEADERVRNRAVVPPSFKDAHKRGGKRPDGSVEDPPATSGDNSFGDLVFWREVLRHASKVHAGALIVLTHDRKNDWFENDKADEGLTPEFRKRTARPRAVPAPHPLLIREAFDQGAGDLALIDPMYCAVLLESMSATCTNFAAAALDTHLPDLSKKPAAAAARSWATRFGVQAQLLGSGVASGVEGKASDEPFDATSLELEQIRPSSSLPKEYSDIIFQIAEGNLATRTEVLSTLTADALVKWGVASLVALGRTALRMAEASDPAAVDFLSFLRDHSPEIPASVREPVFFGALGAVYFDDDLGNRQPQGSQAGVALLSQVTLAEVRHAVTALGSALGGDRKLLYRPSQENTPLLIEVATKSSADNKSPADLLAIKLDGIDLMTSLQTDEVLRFSTLLEKPPGAVTVQIGALLEILTRYHLLPRQLIESDTNTDFVVQVPEFAGVETNI